MNWLQNIKQNHSLRVFSKRTRKVKFNHDFVDLDDAKKVGFIININQFESRDLVVLTDYITKLEDAGKQVIIVELNFKRKSEPVFNQTVRSIFMNTEHINWLGIPSAQKLQTLNEFKPDILINLDTSENLTSRFICGLSNAKTRAGRYEEGLEDYYELTLDIHPETGLKEMLGHLDHYLKQLQK